MPYIHRRDDHAVQPLGVVVVKSIRLAPGERPGGAVVVSEAAYWACDVGDMAGARAAAGRRVVALRLRGESPSVAEHAEACRRRRG